MRKRVNRPKLLTVRVSFGGHAAELLRALHDEGLHGPTMQLVVEGLVLSEVRRELRYRIKTGPKCVRCRDDGSPCCMCGAGGQKKVPCDAVTGDEL